MNITKVKPGVSFDAQVKIYYGLWGAVIATILLTLGTALWWGWPISTPEIPREGQHSNWEDVRETLPFPVYREFHRGAHQAAIANIIPEDQQTSFIENMGWLVYRDSPHIYEAYRTLPKKEWIGLVDDYVYAALHEWDVYPAWRLLDERKFAQVVSQEEDRDLVIAQRTELEIRIPPILWRGLVSTFERMAGNLGIPEGSPEWLESKRRWLAELHREITVIVETWRDQELAAIDWIEFQYLAAHLALKNKTMEEFLSE